MRRRLAVSDVSGHAVGPFLRGRSSIRKTFTPQQKAEIKYFVVVTGTGETEVADCCLVWCTHCSACQSHCAG